MERVIAMRTGYKGEYSVTDALLFRKRFTNAKVTRIGKTISDCFSFASCPLIRTHLRIILLPIIFPRVINILIRIYPSVNC